MVTTIDLRGQLKQMYNPSAKEVSVVDVPPMHFLMIDGEGDPNGSSFHEAVEALYAASYTLKFMLKKGPEQIDYPVMPLEGLWWTASGQIAFDDRRDWRWTAMIMQPDIVPPERVAQAIAEAARKRHLPTLAGLRFEVFHEGQAAQVLHIGPFAAEWPAIERVHAFIMAQGHQLHGKHHEIYLSDPRRTDPQKLRTVIRQPFV